MIRFIVFFLLFLTLSSTFSQEEDIFGSLRSEAEIDTSLLNAAGIKPYERIDIYNITNGERFTTYAIEGKPETGVICVNGAACHKVKINDNIIICTYADLSEAEFINHKPTVIRVNEKNKILESESHINVSLVEK